MKQMKKYKRVALIYILVGIAILTAYFIIRPVADNPRTMGIVMIFMGICFLVRYLKAKKNYDLMKKIEIEETDERNIMINQKALSLAAKIHMTIALFAVIILDFLDMEDYSQIIYLCIIVYFFIYAICYNVISRKH